MERTALVCATSNFFATSTEKSTVQQGKLNAVSSVQTEAAPQELGAPAPVPTACSLDDPDCEACQ